MRYAEVYEYLVSLQDHISKRFNKIMYFNIELTPSRNSDGYVCFIHIIGEIETEKKYLHHLIQRELDLLKLEKLINIVVKNSLDSNSIDAHEKLLLHNHTCNDKEMLLMH